MKKKLVQFEDLYILKRNESLLPNCCYILNSESVAKNMYFRTKRDVIRAHEMFTRHLIPIMDILEYLITPTGWMLVVSIKSEEEIIENIQIQGIRSNKMRVAVENKNTSVIISECIRYAISGMVEKSNPWNGRIGTLVRCNFSRFIFGSTETAEYVMKKMKAEQIRLCHHKKRYVPSTKGFDMDREFMKKGDAFLCTQFRSSSLYPAKMISKVIKVSNLLYHVLHKKINITFNSHFPQKSTNSSPNHPLII